MDFRAVVAGRRMVRSFADRPVPSALVDRILGHAQGVMVVLDQPADTSMFWDHVSEPQWRRDPDWPGLLRAPVIILPLADREGAGLVDASFATMVVLLAAVDAGLGALFFRISRGEAPLVAALGVPGHYRPIGAVALGWPDGKDRPSSSQLRARRPIRVHRGPLDRGKSLW